MHAQKGPTGTSVGFHATFIPKIKSTGTFNYSNITKHTANNGFQHLYATAFSSFGCNRINKMMAFSDDYHRIFLKFINYFFNVGRWCGQIQPEVNQSIFSQLPDIRRSGKIVDFNERFLPVLF